MTLVTLRKTSRSLWRKPKSTRANLGFGRVTSGMVTLREYGISEAKTVLYIVVFFG